MKKYIVFLLAGVALTFSSCKKESPLESLGHSNGAVQASLRVTLNDRNPLPGSDIIITASTWHINDEIETVEFYKTSLEKYTVNLELENTELNNWKSGENPVFLIADSLVNNELWKTVGKSELNSYFQTVADAYVIRQVYEDFNPVQLEGVDLINSLTDSDFASLKSSLSNNINPADYRIMFPTAPASDIQGAVLSTAGKLNLVTNLTKTLLIDNMKSAYKTGQLIAQLRVKVTAKGNAVSEVNNEFQSKY